MKKFFLLLCLIGNITNISCQNNDKSQVHPPSASADSIVFSFFDGIFIYPLTSDKTIEKDENARVNCIYPLLILNGIIIREEEKIGYFRNNFQFKDIKSTKRISKEKAEKMGIPNVPADGVIFVTMKKGYYFDFSCMQKE